MKLFFVVLMCSLMAYHSSGQTFLMDGSPIATCQGLFLDSGGIVNDYGADENLTTRICPFLGDDSHVSLFFQTLQLGSGDSLCIYDGPDAMSPLLICIKNNLNGENLFVMATAENPSGCLTLVFNSDGSDQGFGWNIAMDCATPCQDVEPVLTNSNPIIDPVDTGWIDICFGELIELQAEGIYPQDGLVYSQSDATSTFTWYFGDGHQATGQNVQYQYSQPGGYIVHLIIRDVENCVNEIFLHQRVRVGLGPAISYALPIPSVVCDGDTLSLNSNIGNYSLSHNISIETISQNFIQNTTSIDSSSIPDDGNTSLNHKLWVFDFDPSARISSAADIVRICLNIEHSQLWDLDIDLICPNGRRVPLHTSQINASKIELGLPYEADDPNPPNPIPGVGATYCWEMSSLNGTMENYAQTNLTGGGMLPAMNYNPEGDFIDLVNCPLNGEWQLEIRDQNTTANGWVFDWNIEFDPGLFPTPETFNPGIVSRSWTSAGTVLFQSMDSIAVLASGPGTEQVSFTAIDELGCMLDTTFDIQVLISGDPSCDPCIFAVDIFEQQPVLCYGDSTGILDVNLLGGSGPFTFYWSSGDTTFLPQLDQVWAGWHNVTVEDGNGCLAKDSIEISEPLLFYATTSSVPESCPGRADGQATVTPFDGDGNYSFLWSDPVGQTSATAINLNAGLFEVTVTDGNDCTAIDTVSVAALDSMSIDSVIVNSHVLCYGGFNGSASVFASGGNGTYSYMWNDPLNQLAQTAVLLAAGDYQVTVSDASGCIVMGDVTIDEPDSLEYNIVVEDVFCKGDSSGSAMVNMISGTDPFQFYWSYSGAPDTTLLENLPTGNYFVTITDSNGCNEIVPFSIKEPLFGMSLQMLQTKKGCFGSSANSVQAMPQGGSGYYNFNWENGDQTDQVTDLIAGWFLLTVTDDQGCSVVDSILITEYDSIAANLVTVEPTCHGISDGQLGVNIVTGGAGNGQISDYNFLWSNFSNQNMLTNIEGDIWYSVTITDFIGCSGIFDRYLEQPEALQLDFSINDPTCFGYNNGNVIANPNGGAGGFQYSWDPALFNTNINTATDVAAGIYTISLADANGCNIDTTFTINDPLPISIVFNLNGLECEGDSGGVAVANGNGGNGSFQFEWSDGVLGPENPNIEEGIFYVTATDSKGCIGIDTLIVDELAILSADIIVTGISCFGKSDGIVSVQPSGGTPPYTFSLNDVDYDHSGTRLGLEAGQYEVFILDSKGCELSQTFEILEPLPIEVDAGIDHGIEYGDSIQLYVTSFNAVGIPAIFWKASFGTLSCVRCEDPWVAPTFTTQYIVDVIDENGCKGSDVVTVTVNKTQVVEVPTGFTPNNDGQNDLLLVHGKSGTRVTSFRIFDRWGEMVFQQDEFYVNDMNVGWDGFFDGEMAPGGVYVWMLEVEYTDGTSGLLKGHTSLIR